MEFLEAHGLQSVGWEEDSKSSRQMWCLEGKGSPQQVVKQESLGETPRRTVTVKGRAEIWAVSEESRGKVNSVKNSATQVG